MPPKLYYKERARCEGAANEIRCTGRTLTPSSTSLLVRQRRHSLKWREWDGILLSRRRSRHGARNSCRARALDRAHGRTRRRHSPPNSRGGAGPARAWSTAGCLPAPGRIWFGNKKKLQSSREHAAIFRELKPRVCTLYRQAHEPARKFLLPRYEGSHEI